MFDWDYFRFLIDQAIIHDDLWIITVTLIAWGVLAYIRTPLFASVSLRRWSFVILVPFVIPLFLLVIGTLFRAPDNVIQSRGLAGDIPLIILGLQGILHLVAVIRLKGFRHFLIALAAVQMWFSAFPALITSLSMSGNWL